MRQLMRSVILALTQLDRLLSNSWGSFYDAALQYSLNHSHASLNQSMCSKHDAL